MFLSIGLWACSSAWIEQVASNHKVGGSNPPRLIVFFTNFIHFINFKVNRFFHISISFKKNYSSYLG